MPVAERGLNRSHERGRRQPPAWASLDGSETTDAAAHHERILPPQHDLCCSSRAGGFGGPPELPPNPEGTSGPTVLHTTGPDLRLVRPQYHGRSPPGGGRTPGSAPGADPQ